MLSGSLAVLYVAPVVPQSTTQLHTASDRPSVGRTGLLLSRFLSARNTNTSEAAPSHHYFTKPHHVTTLGTMMSYLIPTVVLSACLSRFYSKHEKFAAAAAVMANISAVARQVRRSEKRGKHRAELAQSKQPGKC